MGKLFDGITKAGISQDGKTSYYDSPGEAGKAMASKSAPLAQPQNFNIASGPIPMLPTPAVTGEMPGGGTDMAPALAPAPAVNVTQAAAPPIPASSIPQAAKTTPDTPLTTKGQILKTVLQGLVGASAGAGARTGGEGFARGLAANQSIESEIRKKKDEDLNNQLRQAQIDNLPMVAAQHKAELERTQAQTAADTAKANRGDFMYSKKGIVNIGPHGDFKIIPGTEPDGKPSLEDNAEGRKAIIASLKQSKDYALTPREEQLYIATGTKPSGTGNKLSDMDVALRAAGVTDPSTMTPEQASSALAKLGASRPNYGGANAEAADHRKKGDEGNAQIFASKALAKAGGDHMAALKQIDNFVSSSKLTPEQAAIVGQARRQIDAEYRASQVGKGGKKDPVADILNTIMNPQPATN